MVNLMVPSRMGSATQDVIQAQAKQALSGLNAEMWSSYMQFCEEEKEKESRNLSQSPWMLVMNYSDYMSLSYIMCM